MTSRSFRFFHPLSRALTLAFLIAPLLVSMSLFTTSCKQGEGEICQINDDCEGDLICNAATGRCQTRGAGVVDASPSVDSSTIDAAIADAAPPDAAPPDAAPPDAAPLFE